MLGIFISIWLSVMAKKSKHNLVFITAVAISFYFIVQLAINALRYSQFSSVVLYLENIMFLLVIALVMAAAIRKGD